MTTNGGNKKTFKKRVFEILRVSSKTDGVISRTFDVFIVALVFLNVIVVILETVHPLADIYHDTFRIFDIFSVTVFLIEYLLRIWTSNLRKPYTHPVWGRLRFIVSPLALIDLLAILPSFLPFLFPFELRSLRLVRILRLFALFKMGRYSESLRVIGNVVRSKRHELFNVLFILVFLLTLSSSLMYFVEHEAQPVAFSNIPKAMWWGIITLTTVGYGDIHPITPLGQLLGGVTAVLAVGLLALPAGILGSGFFEEVERRRHHRIKICPHCGRKI